MRKWEIRFLQGKESCNLYNIFCLFAPHPDDLTGFSALIVSGGSRWLEQRVHNGRTLLSALFRSWADFFLYSGSLPHGLHLGREGLSEHHVGWLLMKQVCFSLVELWPSSRIWGFG